MYLGLTLFRLYYESARSQNKEAFGLKQQHILDGVFALGRLECRSYHSVQIFE